MTRRRPLYMLAGPAANLAIVEGAFFTEFK
jgi:hypothetical protein